MPKQNCENAASQPQDPQCRTVPREQCQEVPTQKCETVSVKYNSSLNKSFIFTYEYSFPGTTTILSECSQTSGGKSLSKYSKTTVPTSKIYFYD